MFKAERIAFPEGGLPIVVHKERTTLVDDFTKANQAIHEAIEIKLFYKGSATLLIGNERLTPEEGDVVLVNPYEFHATVNYPAEEQGRYHLFMIGLDLFEGLPSAGINLRELFLCGKLRFNNLYRGREDISRELYGILEELEANDSTAELSLLGHLCRLFSILMRSGAVSASQGEDFYKPWHLVEPAVRMIRDSYREPLDVETLAYSCKVNKYHFCRVFKSVTGQTPIAYLNRHRLNIASAMITGSDMPISEIAPSVGFSDVAYFSRVFKRVLGCTPASMRKRG